MKTNLLKTTILLIVMIFSIISCKKDDTTPASAVSNDEAASAVGDMVASDFAVSSSGAASVSSKDASKANGRISMTGRTESTSCGVLKDSTITRSNVNGALITYNDSFEYIYTMACTGVIPTSLNLTVAGSNTRTGIKVSSAGTSDGTYTLTGFAPATSNYTINGTFGRTETVTENVGSKSYTAIHQWTVAGVLVDKSTNTLQGGTITYTMTGTYGSTTFTHSGTITFLGSGSATITVNGNNYTLDLVTGTVTKA